MEAALRRTRVQRREWRMVEAREPTPEQAYDEFVKDTFSHLSTAFEIEGGAKRQRVKASLDRVLGADGGSAALRVVDGRFALGGDDSCYLQSGLSLLWTTATRYKQKKDDGGFSDIGEALAPAGLYQPDAIDGIRTGLIRAMKQKGRQMLEDAPTRLKTAAAALEVLMGVEAMRTVMVKAAFKPDAVASAVSLTRARSAPTVVLASAPASAPSEATADLLQLLKDVRTFDSVGSSKEQNAENAKTLTRVMEALLKTLRTNRDTELVAMIQTSIAKQADTIQQLTMENETLKKEVSDLEGQNNVLLSSIRKLETAMREMETDVESLEDENEGLTSKNYGLERKIESMNENARDLLRRVKSTEQANSHLQDEKSGLELDNSFLEQQKSYLNEERERLGVAFERAQKLYKQLVEQKNEGDQNYLEQIRKISADKQKADTELAKVEQLLSVANKTIKETDSINEVMKSSGKAVLGGIQARNRVLMKGISEYTKAHPEDGNFPLTLLKKTVNEPGFEAQVVLTKDSTPDRRDFVEAFGKNILELRDTLDLPVLVLNYDLKRLVDNGTLDAAIKGGAAIEQLVNGGAKVEGRELAVTGELKPIRYQLISGIRNVFARFPVIPFIGPVIQLVASLMMFCALVLRVTSGVWEGPQGYIGAFPLLGPPVEKQAADPSVDLGHMPAYALRRGLLGQRAPLERSTGSATDELLSYQLPCPSKLAKVIPQLRRLADTPLTDEEERSVAMPIDRHAAHTADDAMARLAGNFATMPSPSTEAGGIEPSHALRWAPVRGRTGVDMATVAALEHAAARCTALASAPETPSDEAALLRSTAASLKFSQMESLYRLHEATTYAESADSTPLAVAQRGAKGLVTRPCAVVRDVLCFPTDAGVVAEPMDVAQGAHDASLRLANAMKRTEPLTRKLRNRIRASTGAIPDVYVAPDPAELGFVAAPTGVTYSSDEVDDEGQAHEALRNGDYTVTAWRRILQRGLMSARVVADATVQTQTSALLNEMLDSADASGRGAASSSVYERRDGLWTEFRRNVGISHDRLWVFVRLMSGSIGGDVNEIVTMADDATMKATKAIQEQRLSISKRVSDMQAKIVETVVGSMVRESKLTMDKRPIGDGPAEELVVIDGGAKQQLDELASGESGRPFFEANVALRNLQDGKAMSKTRLSDLLRSLASVGTQLQESLETTLASPAGGATLVELSHPANCYFVSLRADATAAIRVAHERLNIELGMRHGPRRLSLWELVEGSCTTLVTRFAEFCGYVLVQARSSTGTSAMYVSQTMIMTNSLQARVALERLVAAAMVYCSKCPLPSFELPDAGTGGLTENRRRAMTAGEQITDRMIGQHVASTQMVQEQEGPRLPAPISESGWGVIGGFRR